jgi:hypothetical protein
VFAAVLARGESGSLAATVFAAVLARGESGSLVAAVFAAVLALLCEPQSAAANPGAWRPPCSPSWSSTRVRSFAGRPLEPAISTGGVLAARSIEASALRADPRRAGARLWRRLLG